MIKDELNKWLEDKKIGAKLERPAIEKFGDFAIRAEVDFDGAQMVERTENVAGFTNIWIKNEWLIKEAEQLMDEVGLKNNLGKYGQGKTMVIDYSAPNIAKPFGIGHLRSTDIGQAIYNIYQLLGWKCIGDNHLGDWGTQFGKLIVAIKKWWPGELTDLTINELEKLYVRFHSEAEKDETLVDQGREWFEKLEKGDEEARAIWQNCIDISNREFDRVYELLGVKIDYTLGESFYTDKMATVVEELKDKKLVTESQGALIVEFEGMPPAMVTKTNGTTTYFTRDLATVKYRMETWNPDLIIYEVGSDQILHFKQVFEMIKMMGYGVKMVHVPHGMIRWASGKFSTRDGHTIHLEEVIEKAVEEAKKIAPDNTEDKIMAVAVGAIKFNDLGQDPKKDIIFDWEKVMSMDGNSGPYLQYTYARCQSVLAKTKIADPNLVDATLPEMKVEESSLLRELTKFEEKLVEAGERFNPAVWAEYLLSVARKYNEFYAKHRIIDQKEEEWRVWLTKTTATVIKLGLGVLGIKTIEKM